MLHSKIATSPDFRASTNQVTVEAVGHIICPWWLHKTGAAKSNAIIEILPSPIQHSSLSWSVLSIFVRAGLSCRTLQLIKFSRSYCSEILVPLFPVDRTLSSSKEERVHAWGKPSIHATIGRISFSRWRIYLQSHKTAIENDLSALTHSTWTG